MTDDKVKEAVERLKAALTDRMIHSTDDHCNLMTSARQADISWLLAERDNYAVLEAETVRLREIEGRLFERGFTTGAEAIAFIDSVLDRAEAAEAKLTALVEALESAEYAFTHGTFNQRADNAREIIRQALAHHSAPVGEATPVKHTMTLNLTDEEMAALEKMAAEQALKPQTVFRQALRVYQLYSLPEGHPERIGRSPTYGADRLALPSQCPGCDLPADMVGGCGSPNCYWKANVAALPAAPTSAPVEDVGGLERDTTKLAATALTDAELIVEQTRVEKLWDGMFEPDENGEVFEGHGGSPGEWMHERMMEIAQEQQRRAALSPSLIQPQADLTIGQEPKYRFEGGRIINRASGEAIPLDEPVMIFRARDRNAAEMIEFYRGLCKDYEHRCIVARRVDDFVAFAKAHPDRMKEPDTAPIQPQGEERS